MFRDPLQTSFSEKCRKQGGRMTKLPFGAFWKRILLPINHQWNLDWYSFESINLDRHRHINTSSWEMRVKRTLKIDTSQVAITRERRRALRKHMVARSSTWKFPCFHKLTQFSSALSTWRSEIIFVNLFNCQLWQKMVIFFKCLIAVLMVPFILLCIFDCIRMQEKRKQRRRLQALHQLSRVIEERNQQTQISSLRNNDHPNVHSITFNERYRDCLICDFVLPSTPNASTESLQQDQQNIQSASSVPTYLECQQELADLPPSYDESMRNLRT